MAGPPEVTTGHLERYVAQEGDTVKLSCPIIGTPRPIIEWYQVRSFKAVINPLPYLVILVPGSNLTYYTCTLHKHIFQDDRLVDESRWHRFRTNRRHLKIKSVEIVDSGIFICKGVNGFGSVSVQIQLVVRGKKDKYT